MDVGDVQLNLEHEWSPLRPPAFMDLNSFQKIDQHRGGKGEVLEKLLKSFLSKGLIPPDASMYQILFLLVRLPLAFVLSEIHKDLCALPGSTIHLNQEKITCDVSKLLVKNPLCLEMILVSLFMFLLEFWSPKQGV